MISDFILLWICVFHNLNVSHISLAVAHIVLSVLLPSKSSFILCFNFVTLLHVIPTLTTTGQCLLRTGHYLLVLAIFESSSCCLFSVTQPVRHFTCCPACSAASSTSSGHACCSASTLLLCCRSLLTQFIWRSLWTCSLDALIAMFQPRSTALCYLLLFCPSAYTPAQIHFWKLASAHTCKAPCQNQPITGRYV